MWTSRNKPAGFPHRRPPWWPEGESFPPAGPHGAEAWHRLRGRFFWRAGCLLALLLFFACSGFTVLVGLSAAIGGWLSDLGLSPQLALAAAVASLLVIGLGFSLTARALRRMVMPVAGLMEATVRVTEGDYSARVSEHGPRDVRTVARAFNTMAERLQTQDRQRRNLLADITHELRTPLTIIQGNLEGLLDGVYPRDDLHLEGILDDTRVMSRLIDDLHTLAMAESGALKLQKGPVDLALLVNETAASFQAQADRAGVTLVVEVDPDLPVLELDAARMREVLSNLLSNAMHHTPGGGSIRVMCEAQLGDAGVTLTVSDTGVGVPPADLPHIFERFYKSPDSRGAGLGLSIAKNLVEAHGGEIKATSVVGEGTRIQVMLPYQ